MAARGPAGPARSKAPPLGIDLGTTFCCMAYLDETGDSKVIRTRDGSRTMPSVVAFSAAGRTVGKSAKTDIEKSDRNTVFDAKRLIGRRFDDPEVQADLRDAWPFVVEATESGLPRYVVKERGQEKRYSPEQISGFVLEELREAAEKHFGPGVEVSDVVITVPAYFNENQRKATQSAAKIAGLNVLHMINEPTAAALSFGLARQAMPASQGFRNVLVFDLGGGTFDVVLLKQTVEAIEVQNVGGDTHLGGSDFVWHIISLALHKWNQQNIVAIGCGTKAWRRLRLAAEAALRELSARESANIDLSALVSDEDMFYTITRADFEFQVEELLKRCIDLMLAVIFQSDLQPADIDDVVVVGGASRIPWLRNALRQLFGGNTQLHMTDSAINADEAVAQGAAVIASRYSRSQAIADAARPSTSAARASRGQPLTADALAKEQHDEEEMMNRRLDSINLLPPDMGPAIKEAVPRSIGVRLAGPSGIMKKIVMKGDKLPAKGQYTFTTHSDNQHTILFEVFEGDDRYVASNHKMGQLALTDIAPAKAGEPDIELTMLVEEDSVLQSTAVDRLTGHAVHLKVNPEGRASEAEVEAMVAAAKADRQANARRPGSSPMRQPSDASSTGSSSKYGISGKYGKKPPAAKPTPGSAYSSSGHGASGRRAK